MFFHKSSTVEFGLTQVPLHDTIGIASNRSSFRSINTINTGLSLLTELDEREDMGRYALEEGENTYCRTYILICYVPKLRDVP